MQTADSVQSTVTEEPPTRNVRVARRGVAGGLVALVAYLMLAMYSATAGWAHNEAVSFARAGLTVAMVAGLGLALFGYGVDRSERLAAAAKAEHDRLESDRVIWERDRFDELGQADAALAAALGTATEEVRQLRMLVAQAEIARGRHRRRPGGQQAAKPRTVRNGENVIPMAASPDVMRAARNLAKRVVRRAEDNPEDRR